MPSGDIVVLLAKVSLVLAIALLTALLLWRAPRARHRLWTTAFVTLLAMPLLVVMLPAFEVPLWRLPVHPGQTVPLEAQPSKVATVTAERAETAAAVTYAAEVPAAHQSMVRLPTTGEAVFIIWLLGSAGIALSLAVSILRVRMLAGISIELNNPGWRLATERIARQLGMKRAVCVVASPGISTPMAGGVVRPTVFVPADAISWTPETRDMVLSHEIAHLAHHDPLRNLAARCAVSLYWFHPLVWLASRKAATACEQACDDAVLSLGIRPSAYASILMNFADAAPLKHSAAAVPMIRRSLLETRLMTILDRTPRPAPHARAFSAAVFVFATLCIAAARPATDAPPPPELPVIEASSMTELPVATPKPTPTRPTLAPTPPQARDCGWDDRDGRSFTGNRTNTRTNTRTGSTYISEQVGRRGNDHIIQRSEEGLRICAMAIGDPERTSDRRPSDWTARADRVVLETRQPDDVRTMEIEGSRVTWIVNGREQEVDGRAREWRERLLDALDAVWESSRLRGQVSSLQGEISSIQGQRSSLQGEISSLRGEVSSMQGQISSFQGQESSLRGEISSIRGHVSSLQGQISSERGAISSLSATRWDASASERERIADRIRRHEERIRDIEDEIRRYDEAGKVRAVERRIADLQTDRNVQETERRIRDFDLEARIAQVNRRLEDLDVERRVRSIEREIDGLNYDRRVAELQDRVDDSMSRLRTSLRGR